MRFALVTQQFYSLLDSASVCQFVYGPAWQLYGPDHLSQALNAVTGWDTTVDELVEVGARKLTMQRLFNAREGAGRNADVLPKKLFKPLTGGPSDGYRVTEEQMAHALDRYYAMAGWDVASGMPSNASLQRYGLDWASDAPGAHQLPGTGGSHLPAGSCLEVSDDAAGCSRPISPGDRPHEDHLGAVMERRRAIGLFAVDEGPGLLENCGHRLVARKPPVVERRRSWRHSPDRAPSTCA